MSPYTVITEAAWRRWLRQERPWAVEFLVQRPAYNHAKRVLRG